MASTTYSIDQFLSDARRLLDEHGETAAGFDAVGAQLRELGRQSGIISAENLTGLHGTGATSTILAEHEDGSCALMLARFPAEAPTPIHNHNSWGVACVIQARDRYQRWERLDDGRDPHRAELRLVWERELATGDAIWFGPPPHDIHSQQGVDDAAWELVFFGTNPMTRPRAYFDPVTNTVTYDDPQTVARLPGAVGGSRPGAIAPRRRRTFP